MKGIKINMIAKVCDRCGRYYKLTDGLTVGERFVKSMRMIAESLDPATRARNEIANRIEEHCDFCPECSESFKNWLKEGANNEQSKRTQDGFNAGEVFVDELHTSEEQ